MHLERRAFGLYQLIFPVYALGFSLTCAGIELILARLVAKDTASRAKKRGPQLLYTALLITVSFSSIVTLFLQNYAGWIAVIFLRDPRCAGLLVILSYVFPFAAIHSCICGYYFGQKETGVPAVSQLIEQSVRIGSVFLIYFAAAERGLTADVSFAVVGLAAGELASLLLLPAHFESPAKKGEPKNRLSFLSLCRQIPRLLLPSLPLTGNRVLLNLLQSAEAVSIPLQLKAGRYDP